MTMIKHIIATLILLMPSLLRAQDDHYIAIKGGAGVFRSAEPYFTATQFFAMTYQAPLWKSIYQQGEFGMFSDGQSQLGRKSSGYGCYQLGPHLNFDWTYMEFMTGVGFISQPDSVLGGPFEFFHDLGVGIRDKNDFTVGVGYKHISSAGIYHPNLGRDMVYLKIAIPINWGDK